MVWHLSCVSFVLVAIAWECVLADDQESLAGWKPIPLAGNAFQIAPSFDSKNFQREGTVKCNGGDQCAVYFHLSHPSTVSFGIRAQALAGEALLDVRLGNRTTELKVEGTEERIYPLGDFFCSAAGYQRFELAAAVGRPTAILRDLLLRTSDPHLEVRVVSNNEGNMFYWGRRGPSVHLTYEVPRDVPLRYGYSEIMVPRGSDLQGSYFMANGFAEGYFGIQVNSPTERRVLFSVWSPFQTDDPRKIPEDQRVVLLRKGPDVRTGEFGNEGSGGQSYLVYPWKAETTYRFLTEIKPVENESTRFTSWFGDKSANEWRLIASFLRPKTETNYRRFHSFLENFDPARGHLERRGSYRNVWVQEVGGKWHEVTQAKFSVDATGKGLHRLDYSGGVDNGTFFLRNCGFFNERSQPGEVFVRRPSGEPPPSMDGIELSD